MLHAGTTREAAKNAFFIALLSFLLAAPPVSAQQPAIGLVVFGDSLSDTGNAFALERRTGLFGIERPNNTPPHYQLDFLLVPDAPYPRGGHNLTNGAPWVQVLARSLGLAANAAPAFRSESPRATNYAVDRARARNVDENIDLPDQVNRFLHDFGGSASAQALYVIEIGGSDIRDALFGVLQAQDPAIILNQALQSIADNITTLYLAGARKFLVWNVANIALTPSVRIADTQLFPNLGVAALAETLTQVFNANLETLLATLEVGLPGIEIVRFDLYATVNTIISNPAAFGLTNVIAPCITPGLPPFTCRRPDEYFFWDGVHPTRVVHAIIAQQVEALLAQ
jgi:phospholipase/lecithinase/hemolysin